VVHVLEQPSAFVVFVSSQDSAPATMPSPQALASHSEGAPWQTQPASKPQVPLQPSPLTLWPSSHCSMPATMPSPQAAAAQTDGVPGHDHPSSVRQVAEQPSLATVPPSSQVSAPTIRPSPQVSVQLVPLPSNPVLQAHVNEPIVLVQAAFVLQLSVSAVHSFTSAQSTPFPE
jgi:hypothetical protein